MTLAPGTTVGRYQILEPLGQGGMATVYKAFQPSLQREVALKVLRPGYAQDQEFRERFEREAIAIAKLRHPHIVQVFDFEIASSGEYVLAMEFLEGGTLKERLTRLAAEGRGLDPAQSVRVVGEVAAALGYAHEKGVIHRDVKPSNVMLTQKDWAVVTDFGIARILGATSHTQTGVGIGTPEYMAPEQGQGSGIDHRADIYSLGALAYELLTGRVPYSADTPLAVVLAHIKDPLPLPSKVNPTIGNGVERVLLKALAKDPAQRYDGAVAFADALRAGLAEDTKGGTLPTVIVRGATAVAPASVSPVAAPAPKQFSLAVPSILARRPVMLGVAGALVLVVITGSVLASNALRGSTTVAPTTAPATSAAPAAAATAQPTSAPGVKFAIPPKGRPIFEAKLDGSGSDMTKPTQLGDASATALRQVPGAIELELVKPNMFGGGRVDCAKSPDQCVNVSASFNMPRVANYVGELDIAVAPGADVLLNWNLSSVRGEFYTAIVQTVGGDGGDGVVYLGCHATVCPQDFTVSDPTPVPAIRAGKPFTLAAVVEEKQITLFVDQKQVARISASILGLTSVGLRLNGPGEIPGKGLVKITGARFYELPATSAAPAAPTPTGTSSAAAAPKFAIPAKGALIADMPLTASLFRGTNQGLSPNRIDVRFTPGAAEFTARQPNSALNGDINRVLPEPDRYIVELDLAAGPASDLDITYVIRQWAFQSEQQKAYGSYALAVSANTFAGGIQLYARPEDRIDTVGGTVAGVADMQKGFTIAIVVQHPTYTIFLDGKQIVRFSVTGELGSSRPALGAAGQSGSIKLAGLRFYELPK